MFNIPLLDSNHHQLSNKEKNEERNQEIWSERTNFDLSFNLRLNSNEIWISEYSTEISSIQIKICSKNTLRSTKNQSHKLNRKNRKVSERNPHERCSRTSFFFKKKAITSIAYIPLRNGPIIGLKIDIFLH